MPLPPRLQRYDSLIDLLVEQLAREMETPDVKTPARMQVPVGVSSTQHDHDQYDHGEFRTAAEPAATNPPLP
jgi:hypothetical protein